MHRCPDESWYSATAKQEGSAGVPAHRRFGEERKARRLARGDEASFISPSDAVAQRSMATPSGHLVSRSRRSNGAQPCAADSCFTGDDRLAGGAKQGAFSRVGRESGQRSGGRQRHWPQAPPGPPITGAAVSSEGRGREDAQMRRPSMARQGRAISDLGHLARDAGPRRQPVPVAMYVLYTRNRRATREWTETDVRRWGCAGLQHRWGAVGPADACRFAVGRGLTLAVVPDTPRSRERSWFRGLGLALDRETTTLRRRQVTASRARGDRRHM